MKSYLANNESEFKIYEEILHGRLNPSNSIFNDKTILPKLVEFANHREILIEKKELEFIKSYTNENFTTLGYRSINDMIIQVSDSDEPDQIKVEIVPGTCYLLGDIMNDDIDKPPDFKSMYFLKLLIDEFERIKIRSCALLQKKQSIQFFQRTIIKNLRIAEHLLRETTAIRNISKSCDSQDESCIYIIDCLKKFIVKSIHFYHDLFDPHLREYRTTSEQLIQKTSQLSSPNIVNYLLANDHLYSFDSKNRCNEPNPKYFNKDIKAKWLGKINKLTTIFYNLVEEGNIQFVSNSKKTSKNSVTNMALVEFICDNFLDINGDNLSKDTIRTYLNPHRPDKRSKRSQRSQKVSD